MKMPHSRSGIDQREALRASLIRGKEQLDSIAPILGHLLSTPDCSLFSDEIVARVRGMINDLAWQVLRAQAEATGHAAREEFADRHGEALAAHLQSAPALLGHCHSLALEWQIAARLEAVYGLDPVLSPLVQDLIATADDVVASAAMAALAAQARFVQTQRRMELPLAELPGDLFHHVLLAWRDFEASAQSDAMIRAEAKLRNQYDESRSRLALFARLVADLGENAQAALDVRRAGAAIFFTALSARSGQSRELALISSNSQHAARLALGLRAAGLEDAEIEAAMLDLHADVLPPSGVSAVGPREAQQWLNECSGQGRS